MSNHKQQPINSLEMARAECERLKGTGMTYKQIGALYGVGGGNVWNLMHGKIPLDNRIREAFGLAPIIGPPMHQTVRVCSIDGCEVPFVPNSPLRTRCFKCSPYKGKERR